MIDSERYSIVRSLAVGGMAEVFLARALGAEGFEKLVALKVIHDHWLDDADLVSMFISEARTVATLLHPNIVAVLDFGVAGDRYFIAMEYVPGLTLRDLLRALKDSGHRLSEGEACAIILPVLEALHYSHEHGIIHRDVSPQNILISTDGQVKVTDFGLAKTAFSKVKTRTGELRGKFAYMAPEQARGAVTDRRSDVFAVGLLLREMLLGEPAYSAANEHALWEAARVADLRPLRSFKRRVSHALAAAVDRASCRAPEQRFATCDEMAEALRAHKGGVANARALARLVSRAENGDVPAPRHAAPRWPRRLVWLAAGALAASAWLYAARPQRKDPVDSAVAGSALAPSGLPSEVPAQEAKQPLGTLVINSRPWAWITVDGKRIENPTPLRNLPLSAGTHSVLLESPGAGRREFQVEISAGQATKRIVDFNAD